MRNIPSKEAISKHLARALGYGRTPSGERVTTGAEGAKYLRFLLERWRDRRISTREMLEHANELLDGFGIECLRSIDGEARACYVNNGETYESTLLLDLVKDNVRITSWGAYVEGQENRGHRFP